eukprot:scaffold23653_cov96-Phaeocystis_antarctica.AAC.2
MHVACGDGCAAARASSHHMSHVVLQSVVRCETNATSDDCRGHRKLGNSRTPETYVAGDTGTTRQLTHGTFTGRTH